MVVQNPDAPEEINEQQKREENYRQIAEIARQTRKRSIEERINRLKQKLQKQEDSKKEPKKTENETKNKRQKKEKGTKESLAPRVSDLLITEEIKRTLPPSKPEQKKPLTSEDDDIYTNPLPTPREYREIVLRTEMQLRSIEVIIFADRIEEKKKKETLYDTIEEATQLAITLLRIKKNLPENTTGVQFINQLVDIYLKSAKKALASEFPQEAGNNDPNEQLDNNQEQRDKDEDNKKQKKEEYDKMLEALEKIRKQERQREGQTGKEETLDDIQDQLDQIQQRRLEESQRQREEDKTTSTDTNKPRQERTKRVANYREAKRIEQRLKRLVSQRRVEDDPEVHALKVQKTKLLFDQLDSLASITLDDEIPDELNTEEATEPEEILPKPKTTLLDKLLDIPSIESVIEDESTPLLESEKARFQRLKELLQDEKLRDFIGKLKIENIRRTLEQSLVNNPAKLTAQQKELLELLSHPELSARVEYLERQTEPEAENITSLEQPTIDSIQEMLEFEQFKKVGDIETRLRLAREEFSSRLMTDIEGGLTLLDLEMILEEYNLASINYPEDQNEEPTLEFSSNIPEELQDKIKTMFERAKRILDQYNFSTEYIEDMTQDTTEGETKTENFIRALDQDLETILQKIRGQNSEESTTEQFNALSTLLNKGVLRIMASPTGFSIVIETLFIDQDEEAQKAFTQLLELLGQQDQKENIQTSGLGVTITSSLENLNRQITQERNPQIKPSINILILPQTAFQENAYERLQRHETQDYIMSQIELGEEETQGPKPRILREFISKTIDGSLFINDPSREPAEIFSNEMNFYFKQNEINEETRKQLYELFLITKDAIEELQKASPLEDIPSEFSKELLQSSIRIEVASILKDIILDTLSRNQDINIEAISKKLKEEFSLEKRQYHTDDLIKQEKTPAPNLSEYFMFSQAGQYTVGVVSTSSQINNAQTVAKSVAPFEGNPVPVPYGKKGTLANAWPYENGSTAYMPLGLVGPFSAIRRIGRPIKYIPLLGWGLNKFGGALARIPIPIPFEASYLARKQKAAFLAYSKDPLRREAAMKVYGGAEVGANPLKFLARISPDLADFAKEIFPGFSITKFDELREYSQEINKFGIYDIKKKLPSWLIQLMLADIGMPQSDAIRYLAEAIPGVKFTYEVTKGYQITFDDDDLRKIRQARDFVAWSQFEQKQTRGFQHNETATGPKYRYNYDYSKNRKKRYDGFVASLFTGAVLRRPSKAQREVKEFFSKHARRSDLPRSIRNLFYWERKIGSKFREYLQTRDGLLALKTLGLESEHAKSTRREDHNLFSLMNLIALGENVTDKDAWLRNNTGRTIKVRFMRNGRTQTAEIAPGEHLLDPDGNLIFKDIKLKTTNGRFELDSRGMLQIEEDDITSQMLWRRLVGDWENPHLRFIRLQSKNAQAIAIKLFGKDPDEGFLDENNVKLRTDGIKKMISNLYMEQLSKVMEIGVAPDRRYAMINTDDGASLIDFYEGFFQKQGDTISSQDTATPAFKRQLTETLNKLKERMPQQFSQGGYIDQLIKELNKESQLTRKRASEIIESILALTQGKKNLLIDSLFSQFVKFSDDPTWESPYRMELPGIDGLDREEVANIYKILSGSVSVMEERYNEGQNFLYQWQKAYFEANQFERLAFGKTTHYKGVARQLTRFTNLAMLVSFGIMATSVSPLAVNSFIISLGLRIFAKPWAVGQEKTWFARRLKALQRAKEISTMDGLFKTAIEGGIPNKHELARMAQEVEELIFFLEDIATAKPDDDWYPKNDRVINKAASTVAWAKSKLYD